MPVIAGSGAAALFALLEQRGEGGAAVGPIHGSRYEHVAMSVIIDAVSALFSQPSPPEIVVVAFPLVAVTVTPVSVGTVAVGVYEGREEIGWMGCSGVRSNWLNGFVLSFDHTYMWGELPFMEIINIFETFCVDAPVKGNPVSFFRTQFGP